MILVFHMEQQPQKPIPGEVPPEFVGAVRALYSAPVFQVLIKALRERTPENPDPGMESHVVAQNAMLRQGYERAINDIFNIGNNPASHEVDPFANILNTAD